MKYRSHLQLGFWESLDRSSVEPICNWFKGYYRVDKWDRVSESDIETLAEACKVWREREGELIDAPFLYRATVIPIDKNQTKQFRTVEALVHGWKSRAASGNLDLGVPELLPFTPFPHVASTYAFHNQAQHVLPASTALERGKALSVIIRVSSSNVQLLLSSTSIVRLLQKHYPSRMFNYFSTAKWSMYRQANKLRSRIKEVVWNYAWAHECICRVPACVVQVAGVQEIGEMRHISPTQLHDMDPRIGSAEVVWGRLRNRLERAGCEDG